MPETILDAVRAASQPQRDALAAEAQTHIAAKNQAYHAEQAAQAAQAAAIAAGNVPVVKTPDGGQAAVAPAVETPAAAPATAIPAAGTPLGATADGKPIIADAAGHASPAVAAPAGLPGSAVADSATVAPTAVTAPVQGAVAAVEGKAGPVFKAGHVIPDPMDATVIIGIGAVAENVDLDNDVLSKAALKRLAHDFCSNRNGEQKFKANHGEELKCDLVQSWIGAPIVRASDGTLSVLKAGQCWPDSATYAGISNEDDTHWFVAVQPSDPNIVQMAKAGQIVGFSWSGFVQRAP